MEFSIFKCYCNTNRKKARRGVIEKIVLFIFKTTKYGTSIFDIFVRYVYIIEQLIKMFVN